MHTPGAYVVVVVAVVVVIVVVVIVDVVALQVPHPRGHSVDARVPLYSELSCTDNTVLQFTPNQDPSEEQFV